MTDAVLPWNVGGKERRLYEILSRLEPATIEPRIFTMKWWDGPSTCNEGGLVHEALLARKSLYTPIGRRSILEAVLFGMASLKLLWKRFDVIDVDSMPFFPVLAMKLMSIIRRKPLLATWHEVWGKPYWVTYLGRLGVAAAMVERLAVRCPDVIISNSEHTSRRLLGLGARKVVTVPLGADLSRLAAPSEPIEPVYDVVYMGRLLEHKNIGTLLQAAHLCREQGRAIRVLVVGDGPCLDSLVTARDEMGLGDLVRFQPFVTEAEYSGTMRSGRIFVLPSLREGFGLVVLEANSCGLPAIVVDHPDNAAVELIQPGLNGLVSGGSGPALAATIREALDNMGRFSVEEHTRSAMATYNWQHISETYSALVCEAVARQGARGLRITEVVPWYPPHLGGMEIASQSLSRALSERGHEVSVVTAAAGRGSGLREGGILVRRCAAVEVARTPIAPGMAVRLGLLRADVMHVHISQAFVPEVASIVSAVTGVPIVAHFHMDVPATRHKKVFDTYKRYVLGPVLRRSHAIAVLTAEQKQFLQETYGVADRVVEVVPNGTDARFSPAVQRKARHVPRRLLFVGRLSPQKNVGRLLRACASLPFPYLLTICGDGVERASLEAEARRLGMTSVDFRGTVSPEQLLTEYRGSDLLVSSSDHEGMPLAVLEAMATGLPVVATDVPGNRETVGGAGLLTPATDAGLAQGLVTVLEDEVLWLDLGARSRRAAAGRGWQDAAAALEGLFVRAADAARTPGSL